MDTPVQQLESLAVQAVRAIPSEVDLVAGDVRMADTAVAAYLGVALAEWATASRAIDSLFGAAASPGRYAVQMATSTRATEVDDIHLGSCTTPGSVVGAAVLALVLAGANRERLRSSVVVGYDVVIALGILIGGPAALARGIWPTRAVASIATALIGAHALDLSEHEAVQALGIAASAQYAGSLPEPARSLGLGHAVAAGLAAALSAAAGMTASAAATERWCEAMQAGTVAALPKMAGVHSVCVKPFPSARQSLGPAVVLRAAAQEDEGIAARVARVRVGVPDAHVVLVDRHAVSNRLESLASVPYQVALAMTTPTVLDDVRRALRDETADFLRLMDCVEVFGDVRCNQEFPERWASRVEIELSDDLRTWFVTDVPGERELDSSAIHEKAARLVAMSGQDKEPLDHLLFACATANYESAVDALTATLR